MAIGRRKFFAGAKPPSYHQCFTSCIASAALLMFAILVVSVTAINDLHDSREQSVKFDPGRFVTEDAIILEVPDKLLRQKRELDKSETISGTVSNVNNNERVQKQLETLLLPTGPCITSKGLLGQCTPFRQCYPYFKLPDLNNWETWILGMYDTCSYFTAQGRQMYGVCCTNTIAPLKPSTPPPVVAAVSETTSTKKPAVEEVSNGSMKPVPNGPYQLAEWPPTHPPLPTHPPDHTIPPLPTHPPSPGFPVQTEPTVSTMMTVKPSPGTTWPTTKPWPTPQWPPVTQPLPTHPPSPGFPTAPTHPTQPAYPTPPSHPTVDPGVPITDASCGAKNGYQDQERIVGGVNAELGEWPWIAALFNGGRQFCGGSLIDSLHILSAAHCVAHMSSWDVARLTVRLGDYNIKTNSEVQHVEKRVKRVVRHRGFDARTLYNDVAIITLDSPVTFNNQIRSICLPSGSGNYAGKTATVIGWGSLRESGPQPGILQKVNIPIWTNAECRQKYGPAAPGGIVEHMLCAGQASRDSCSGDSGGPLMINEGRWTQVGIVSWGIGCGKGQYPGVYTRVTHFLPWINKNRK